MGIRFIEKLKANLKPLFYGFYNYWISDSFYTFCEPNHLLIKTLSFILLFLFFSFLLGKWHLSLLLYFSCVCIYSYSYSYSDWSTNYYYIFFLLQFSACNLGEILILYIIRTLDEVSTSNKNNILYFLSIEKFYFNFSFLSFWTLNNSTFSYHCIVFWTKT